MALDQDVSLKVLADAIVAIKRLNLPYWLTDGTLLGYHREYGFISHDSDIDIGMPISAYTPDILVEMKREGFFFERQVGDVDRGLELTFSKSGINLDIFFFYQGEGEVYHSAWLRGVEIRYRYRIFGLKEVNFRGVCVSVPEDPEAYITQKYGAGWRVPDRTWHWAFSPKNVDYSGIGIWGFLTVVKYYLKHKKKIFVRLLKSKFSV